MRGLVIIFLGLGSLISAWIILAIVLFGDDTSDPVASVVPDQQPVSVSMAGKQVITTWANEELPARDLIQHTDTSVVSADEFYKNSAATDMYEIYYDEPSGHVTVLLASNPLSVSRNLAELQLQQIFSLNQAELCRLRITVAVNAAVNEEFSNRNNLGLSFCPGAIQLP